MTPYTQTTRKQLRTYLRRCAKGGIDDPIVYLFTPDYRYRPGLRPRLALGRSRNLGSHRPQRPH